MSAVVLIRSILGAGGGAIAPSPIDWTNVAVTNLGGSEQTNAQTFSSLTSPIEVRATWAGSSPHPMQMAFIVNGAVVDGLGPSPIDRNIISGEVGFLLDVSYTSPSGNSDSGTVIVTNETRSTLITMTVASPCVISWTGHGFSAGDRILFRTTGALPTGITAGMVYFIIAAGLTADAFEVSATSGGSAINTAGTQSGVHTGVSVIDTFTYAVRFVPGAPP